MTEFQGPASSTDEAVEIFLWANPMELGSATQKIHLRISDVLAGDSVEGSAEAFTSVFMMLLPKSALEYLHKDFIDRAIYVTFAGIYGLRGRGLDPVDLNMEVSAAMIVNMNVYALRHCHWVPDVDGLERKSFGELNAFREVLIPDMIPSPIASLHPSNFHSFRKASYSRTAFKGESRDATRFVPAKTKVKYQDDPEANRGILRAWMQLRPIMQFLPPTFLSEKAGFLCPKNESGRAQTLRLMHGVSDHPQLPPAPANVVRMHWYPSRLRSLYPVPCKALLRRIRDD